MSHWTVGEGRSTPETMTTARMAAEDEARSEWLAEKLRYVFKARGELCKRGHLLDGLKQNGQGQTVRYCKTCKRLAMRLHRKARAG